MSPELNLLTFIVQDNEIIADHLNMKINQCLANKVELKLSENKVNIKKQTTINITTEPFGLCAIAAIDKSVSFMGTRNDIKLNKVI